MVELLALVPLTLALLMALLRPSGQRTWFVVAGSALALVHYAVPSVVRSERVIVIFDRDDPAVLQKSLPAELLHASSLDVIACRLISIGGQQASGAAAGWSPTCPTAARHHRTRSPDLESALGDAMASFESRSRSAKTIDGLLGRGLRIVVVVTSAELWSRQNWQLDTTRHAATAAALGVQVDLVGAPSAVGVPPVPTLEIVPRAEHVPANVSGGGQFSFDLRLRGVATPVNLRDVQRSCVLGGDCFIADGPGACSGGRCNAGHCLRSCQEHGQQDCRDTQHCEAGQCVEERTPKAYTLASSSDTLSATHEQSTLTLSKATFLRELLQDDELRSGWHSLRCRVSGSQQGQPFKTESTIYLQAKETKVNVLWGADTSLAADRQATLVATKSDDVFTVASRELVQSSWFPRDAVYGGATFEAETLAALAAGALPPELNEASTLAIIGGTPRLFAGLCPWLRTRVENEGMNLLVSGVPPYIRDCPFSVYAETTQHLALPMLVHRWPRISFVLDPSRLGRIAFRPARGSESHAVSHTDLPSRRLGEGVLDVQVPVVQEVAKALGLTFDTQAGVFGAAAKERHFLELRVPDNWRELLEGDESGDESEMFAKSDLDLRLDAFFDLTGRDAEERRAARLGVQDFVVAFAYDVAPTSSAHALAKLLGHGAKVLVVPIKSPFANRSSLSGYLKAQTLAVRGPFAKDPHVSERLRVITPDGDSGLDASRGVSLESTNPAHQQQELAAASRQLGAKIAKLILEEADPSKQQVRINALGRFIDERLLPKPAPLPGQPAISSLGGPLVFQRLRVRGDAPRAMSLLELTWPTKARAGLEPLPLAYGSLLGRGHIAYYGYSIAEGAWGFPYSWPWPRDATRLLHAEGMPFDWGMQRIGELAALTSKVEPLPSPIPRVRHLELRHGRFLRVHVTQQMLDAAGSDVFYAQPLGMTERSDSCTESERSIRLPLLELAPQRHEFVYELAPLLVQSLCGAGAGCRVALCRKVCDGPGCGKDLSAGALLVPAAVSGVTENPLEDLPAIHQLLSLSQYSGGEAATLEKQRSQAADQTQLQAMLRVTHVPLLLGLAFVLALMWALTGAARLLNRRTLHREVRSEIVRSMEMQTEGLVRQVGDAIGRPSSQPVVGAFAGFRPFEPGDRLRSAVIEDVVLLTGAAGEPMAIAPRVLQRIEERARRVRLIVNVGRSMQTPSVARASAKLTAACQFTELIAQICWASGGEVVVEVAAGNERSEIVGPAAGPEGELAITKLLKRAARQYSAHWNTSVRLGDTVGGETLIYVSDLLNEDLDLLAGSFAEVELEGASAAFVQIHSPAENLATETVWLGGARSLADRSGLTASDLARAHQDFVQTLQVKLGDARGGLLVVSSAATAEQLLELVKSSLLFELIR